MWKRSISKTIATGLALVAVLGMTGCPCIGGQNFFDDAALESAVRFELGKPFGCLTTAELETVTEVQAANLNIRNLRGIEHLTNLTVLNVQNNRISSITPLTSLRNLRVLDLGFNQITNIDALSGLFFLDEVYLDGNAILSLGPLVANSTNGGLGSGDLVVLPDSVLDSGTGEVQDIFLPGIETLQNAGVAVFVQNRPDSSQ
jgi:hypothetical protein